MRVERPTSAESPTRPTPGRGGAQHKYLQELVRRWGEANGWRATIEERILGGLGSVDVALRKGEQSIAVEIAVTTSVEHEIGNIQKCLAAGFELVIVVSSDSKTLGSLRDWAAADLPEVRNRLTLSTPDGLFDALAAYDPADAGREATIRGYRVKVRTTAGKADESMAKRKSVSQVIAKAVQRLRGNRK